MTHPTPTDHEHDARPHMPDRRRRQDRDGPGGEREHPSPPSPEPISPARLSPYQTDAPHRRSESPPVSGVATRTVGADGVERVVPPSGPLAVSVRSLRHLAPPRRRRWLRAAAVTGALVMLPFSPVIQRDEPAAAGQEEPAGDHDPMEDVALSTLEASRVAYRELDPTPTESQETVPPEPEPRSAIATLDDLRLDAISPETAIIGFHEAAGNTTLSVDPAVPVHENHNPVKSEVQPDREAPAKPKAMVLPPRDRSSGPHSAIDVAVPAGVEVLAPVTGTVVNASTYTLYGQHLDNRIEIVPDDRPDIVVILLHVTGPRVTAGDRVVAGQTAVADSATQFPFRSQIDRFAEAEVGQALPHVHIEIKPTA